MKAKNVPTTYIADTFKRYMKFHGLTTAVVAKKLRRSPTDVSYLLRRSDPQWRIEEMYKFCQATNCSTDLLIDEQRRAFDNMMR